MHAQLSISHLHATDQLLEIVWKRVEVIPLAFEGQHGIGIVGCGVSHRSSPGMDQDRRADRSGVQQQRSVILQIPDELPFAKLPVAPAALHQGVMTASIHNGPLFENHNLIGFLNGGQTMGDHEHGAS